MSNKLVTSRQAEYLRKMANDKGIGSSLFQEALDDSSFAKFLDDLKQGRHGFVPPEGARLHVVRACANHNHEPWQHAIRQRGFSEPTMNASLDVAEQYPPTGSERVAKDYFLLNLQSDNCDDYDKALDWATSVGLKPTLPREVFAIGEQHPRLNWALGFELMYVLATTACFEGINRMACCVRWEKTGDRRASASATFSLRGKEFWYAFSK